MLQEKRLKYTCPCCHEGVKIAPRPTQLLPKSMAAPSLLAHITTTKFVDGVPFTRQSKQFERLNVNIGPGTMALWMNTIGEEKLPPLLALMHEAALAEPTMHCDETTVQVLRSDKAPTTDHYMIVRAAGPPGRRIVLFNYAQTRNVQTLKQILTGPDGPYRGKLVCDGLELYDYVAEDKAFEGMILCGCLVHCRRYYDQAAKVTVSPQGQQLARVALKEFLGKVFKVERQIEEQREARERSGQEWTRSDTLKMRQERSVPVMNAFKAWVDGLAPGVAPKSALGKALGYTQNQWSKLSKFLEHPDVAAHNNRVENDIRPFAVGRRAWLFIDTQRGARASANLYSLAITCRANGINALAYFTYLYENLPRATTVAELEALLPWNVKPLLKASGTF